MDSNIYTTPCKVSFLLSSGMVMPLTPCCKATATGSIDGIACRHCYREVDEFYGGCEDVGSNGMHRFIKTTIELAHQYRQRGCKDSHDCATEVMFNLGLLTERPEEPAEK